ncbi:MAG: hypothetical protein VKK42_16840 [Lyngbya sp.]|nr:hypothetical protein [Lyngbya sp.]
MSNQSSPAIARINQWDIIDGLIKFSIQNFELAVAARRIWG